MLDLQTTTQYRKDKKRAVKRGLPMNLLDEALGTLAEEKPLDPKYLDHELKGRYAGFRECHILPDWGRFHHQPVCFSPSASPTAFCCG